MAAKSKPLLQWGGSVHLLVFCSVVLCMFTGCVQQRKPQKDKASAHRTQQTTLVNPSTELSAQSNQDECAFFSSHFFRSSRRRPRCSSAELVKQYEARLFDVPVLVTSVAKRGYVDDQGRKMLEYTSKTPVNDVRNFYIQEMERFGWQQEYIFEGNELLLHFKKPQRFCSVSIRPVGRSFASSKRIAINLFVSA